MNEENFVNLTLRKFLNYLFNHICKMILSSAGISEVGQQYTTHMTAKSIPLFHWKGSI